VAHREALDEAVRAARAGLDREAACPLLERAGIAYGRLSTLEDLARHPQNRLWPVLTSAGRPVSVLAPGAIVAGEAVPTTRVPALGEHDAQIRAEFMGGR
jgi:crotonobetainyl-CoA:carnitine CoA-transferase CaiB-like acyl-CoA transferase